ncbi:McrB family protein [Rothia nasimurium]|uniref:McrB family protein n=1 Tax=Rothia nasimurium TaxID=85336 RepID=UPI001F02A567|nr:AAA family ATPase [Rothia nasimurium]
MDSPVEWISADKSVTSYQADSNRKEPQSLTFDEFLSLKLEDGGKFHLLSGTVIDFEYTGTNEKISGLIKKYKENYTVGRKSTIGQSLVALAYFGGYKNFLETQAGSLPIAGNIRVNDPKIYHNFLDNFKNFVDEPEFLEIKMVGYSRYDEKIGTTSRVFRNNNLNVELGWSEENMLEEAGGGYSDSKLVISSLNTILEGVAGCGKTYYQKSLFDSQDINGHFGFDPELSETVVFHPSTSYEDFVSGLRPQKGGNFSGKAGIFVELCNRAAADQENNYLLFIDEINRANTAKVFGDLLMVIEEAKRTPKELLSKYGRAVLTRKEAKELQSTRYEDKDPEHAAVRLQTAVDEVPGISKLPEEPLEYLAVPNNLYIVGTMNSTDRSVGTIDLALRRRFTWHTMEPMMGEVLRGKDKVKDRDDLDSLLSWYDEANEKLYTKVGPDARLGHSYFFQDDKTAQQIAHDLLKQLAEIAYIFHLEDLMTESPFNQTINGLRLEMPGDGLGKRVIVAFAPTSPDTETPDGGAEPLESSDESSESLADEG